MNENEKQVHIDYQAIVNQIADKAVVEFMAAIMPDEKSREFLLGMLAVHRKYGIDAVTSVKIIQDLAEVLKEIEL